METVFTFPNRVRDFLDENELMVHSAAHRYVL